MLNVRNTVALHTVTVRRVGLTVLGASDEGWH